MTEKNKSKNTAKIIAAIIIIVFILWIIFALCFSNGLSENRRVTIEQGTSTTDIAEILKDNNIISSKIMFLIKVNISEYKGQLKYGTFEFTPEDDYNDVIKKIATKGEQRKTVTVTIPEGYSCEKIIKKLSEAGFGTEAEIRKALDDDYDFGFLKKITPHDKCLYKLEGFLFPSTYEFYADAKPHDIIERMLEEFEKQYDSLRASYNDLFTVITKASMIEREAKIDSERVKIAGVIENRLKADMRLQIDATVIYALSDGRYDVERVLYKDLETDSPYNTYKYKGLPIGPISNPGLESIKAALNPDESNYLYYRTDDTKNDGSHVFTETFEEHKAVN